MEIPTVKLSQFHPLFSLFFFWKNKQDFPFIQCLPSVHPRLFLRAASQNALYQNDQLMFAPAAHSAAASMIS